MKSRLSIGLLAATLAGCGGSGPVGVMPAPHGGTLIGLPDERGFVEISKREVPGSPGPGHVVVYYLDKDHKVMSPAPTAVTLKRQAAPGKPIELKPAEGADAGAVMSPPITETGEVEGLLSATIDGKVVVIPINVR